MEDVELAMRLQALGEVQKLTGGVEVSTRRWQDRKVLMNAFKIFCLLFKYLFLRRLKNQVKTESFYEDYYSDKPIVKT